MAKKSNSPLVNREEEEVAEAGYKMTTEEAEQYKYIVDRIVYARNQREQKWDYFDQLTYEQTYKANKRAAHSYLQPKKNDDEVRINTGLTEKRIELVLNELLALNLEEEIETFDKNDNLLEDLSGVFTDVVRRTEQMEMARDKDITIYQELLTQPSVFVEELWTEEALGRNSNKKGLAKKGKCERRLLLGPQIYLGDIHLPDTRFNDQPYLVKYARLHKVEAERLFKDLNPEKWKMVKSGAYNTVGSIDVDLYKQNSLLQDEYEVFTYVSWYDNEVQVVLQGVPMLPVGDKYTDYFGDYGGYHITMVSLKPYSGDFAYGKPLTQSAKTLQALNNETIRNLIRKFRQVLEPPIGTAPGKMFSRDIWNPGKITQGASTKDFERLVDHSGVTRSEMTMFDLIEKKTNEFIGTSQQPPLASAGERTATEHMLAQQQAVKLLGLSVLAAMRLKERLALLRVKNILNNYTKPVGVEVHPITQQLKDVYARFSVPGAEVGEAEGERVIQFAERGLTEPETQTLFDREQEFKKQGKNVEFKVVDVNKLKNLELYFYANVLSKPKESTELDKAMVMEKITQGQAITNITGRRMNAGKLIRSFERAWRETDLFEKEAPTSLEQLQQQMQTGEAKPTPTGEKLNNLMRGTKIGAMPQPAI